MSMTNEKIEKLAIKYIELVKIKNNTEREKAINNFEKQHGLSGFGNNYRKLVLKRCHEIYPPELHGTGQNHW